MELTVLLVTRDPALDGHARRIFGALGIAVTSCTRVSEASELVIHSRFDGFLIDCDDLAGGVEFLTELRRLPGTRNAILFAIVNRRTSLSEAFHLGATFALDKPLSVDRLMRCVRAAFGLIIGERRRYQRHPLAVPVEVLRSGAGRVTCYSVNVSSSGMQVEAGSVLEAKSQLRVLFELPAGGQVEAGSEVVWVRDGRAGLRFGDMPRRSKVALTQWLNARTEREIPVAAAQPGADRRKFAD